MLKKKIEKFLEDHNMNYLFLLLANQEVTRLNSLPDLAKKTIMKDEKITEVALLHVAENKIIDYAGDEELFEEATE